MAKKKVLLMGKSGSGKTSMRSFIFANYMARDTMRLSPTLDVEHHHVRFLGNLVLNLWDCGGQDAFYESYFDSQRDLIFRSVEVLIYVFDVESADTEKDLSHFVGVLEVRRAGEGTENIKSGVYVYALLVLVPLSFRASRLVFLGCYCYRRGHFSYFCLSTHVSLLSPSLSLLLRMSPPHQAIDQYSPDAKLFVLIHKMDLVAEDEREAVFLDRQKIILGQVTPHFNFSVTFFKTSIWDETLYKAWSSIVYQLIPNVKVLEHQLESLCGICGADEVGRREEDREGGRESGMEGSSGRYAMGHVLQRMMHGFDFTVYIFPIYGLPLVSLPPSFPP